MMDAGDFDCWYFDDGGWRHLQSPFHLHVCPMLHLSRAQKLCDAPFLQRNAQIQIQPKISKAWLLRLKCFFFQPFKPLNISLVACLRKPLASSRTNLLLVSQSPPASELLAALLQHCNALDIGQGPSGEKIHALSLLVTGKHCFWQFFGQNDRLNKLAKLRRHAGRVIFGSIKFGPN